MQCEAGVRTDMGHGDVGGQFLMDVSHSAYLVKRGTSGLCSELLFKDVYIVNSLERQR